MTATESKKQEKLYAEIAVPVPLRRTFTYRIPGEVADEIAIGARVLVPFGKQLLTGYAVAFHTEPDADVSPEDIRDIAELVDTEPLIGDEILQLTQWASDYYAASWGEILKASLPAGINSSVEKVAVITEAGRLQAQVGPGTTVRARTLAYLAENGRASFGDLVKVLGTGARREIPKLEKLGLVTITLEEKEEKAKPKLQRVARLIKTESDGKKLNAAQEKVISILTDNDGALPAAELIRQAEVSASVLKTLEKNGLIELSEEEVFRDPLLHAALPEINDITLTGAQSEALKKIEAKIAASEYHTFLLHGITGSGKTEVYIRAMRHALAHGRTAMMLVPEIALTPIFSRRLRAIFGDEVAILHSSLSLGERFDEWRRLKSGEARIAIGTRSAVFAPLENLGVIVVDEEHDTSYRQHEQPFYHGRDVAIMRANMANAVVILGSATPSLESFYNAERGKYEYLHLPDRIGNRPLAKAEIIDMRLTFAEKGRDEVFSDELLTSIERTHARGEQSIILLNRRGYSSFILCRKCGESIKCPNCDITLTYHKRADSLVCHYCNFRRRMPDKCPNCTSEFLFYVGEGTEQLADILREKFPHIRSARIDRDTVSRRHLFEDTILDFAAGKLDMLVGTQMLAKGHDFPNVTLVGVVSVDAGLGLPDFRSAERTFQLLTQVAGRAGRGEKPGRVLIQTYYPEHYALQYAQQQDYPGFYKEEIVFRERFGFPPFASLASILVHHANYEYAWQTAQLVRNCLTMANTEKKVVILGPAPAPLARLKGEFRVQILLKSQNRKRLRAVLDRAWAELAERHSDMRVIKVEIDPLNLM
jgi:primosomal protein N' (replication factor Y) (superfamily II helicase)